MLSETLSIVNDENFEVVALGLRNDPTAVRGPRSGHKNPESMQFQQMSTTSIFHLAEIPIFPFDMVSSDGSERASR